MGNRRIDSQILKSYEQYLREEEKSAVTIEKYMRDISRFQLFLGSQPVSKENVIAYKKSLESDYAVASINSMLAAINGFFAHLGWHDCKVKQIKTQRRIFSSEDKELTKVEYQRLIKAAKAKKSDRLNMVIQTITNTGIRISELSYITAQAVRKGRAEVLCKGKIRVIFISRGLQKMLLSYMKTNKITEGQVFTTKNGNPLNRSNIWREMKELCESAGVPQKKVFPHNLRHLFACAYYSLEKDIAKLADILGHSNIETTRIYIMSTGKEHQKHMSALGLLMV